MARLHPSGECVAAIYASTGEVDQNVAAIEFVTPRTQTESIPGNHPPGRLSLLAAKNNHTMAIAVKVPSEDRSDLTSSPGKYRWLGVLALAILLLTFLPAPFAGVSGIDLFR
jgi:hypothetical protein